LVDETVSSRSTVDPSFCITFMAVEFREPLPAKSLTSRLRGGQGGSRIRDWQLLSSHRKLEHSIRCVKGGLHRAIDLASRDLTTAEYLYVSAFEVHVHQNRDQFFSESVHVVEVRQHAGKLVRGGFLHSLQSGFCSRFQGTAAVRAVHSVGMKQ